MAESAGGAAQNPGSGPGVKLDAASPYELRVDLGKHVPETDVRSALATGDMGFLHSFTTGATVDGPGVRVVAWTTGCNFRCLYCHNPDTWTMTNGIPVSVSRATTELRKYRHGLKTMRGGFTLSGGEPLMQHRFALKLLTAAREMGIHTALDTNGWYGDRLEDSDLEAADLVLLDIKSWKPERHLELTGMDIAPTLKFAERLAENRRPMWLRYVLVPGYTDDVADIAEIARFVAGLGNCERADVLPFHQMGKYKWEKLHLDYKLREVDPPSQELIARAVDVFRDAGLKTY
jgi:pyruvate formate lyase activating enzyme